MNIKEQLFAGRLDIVGDIHGEFDALQALLVELGYADDGTHPEGRKLVFVGDLIDRGPDSPAVVEKVMQLVASGSAQCVLGNHELNILRDDKKSENAWFFTESGHDYSTMKPASDEQRSKFCQFFEQLPLVLERDDLRIVHACWNAQAIAELGDSIPDEPGKAAIYAYYRDRTDLELESNGHMADFELEQQEYREKIRYGNNEPSEHWPDARMLPASSIVHEKQQMENPLAVLTSGEERVANSTYAAGGKFRFVQRIGWWDDYRDDKAVVVGHYWRAFNRGVLEELRESGEDLFFGIAPNEWLGPNKNVFCIDFCVGARALARKDDASCDGLKLGALRWPEREVVFHDGQIMQTVLRDLQNIRDTQSHCPREQAERDPARTLLAKYFSD